MSINFCIAFCSGHLNLEFLSSSGSRFMFSLAQVIDWDGLFLCRLMYRLFKNMNFLLLSVVLLCKQWSFNNSVYQNWGPQANLQIPSGFKWALDLDMFNVMYKCYIWTLLEIKAFLWRVEIKFTHFRIRVGGRTINIKLHILKLVLSVDTLGEIFTNLNPTKCLGCPDKWLFTRVD